MERSLWRHFALNRQNFAGGNKKSPGQQHIAHDGDCQCEERKKRGTGENAAASRKQVWNASLLNLRQKGGGAQLPFERRAS